MYARINSMPIPLFCGAADLQLLAPLPPVTESLRPNAACAHTCTHARTARLPLYGASSPPPPPAPGLPQCPSHGAGSPAVLLHATRHRASTWATVSSPQHRMPPGICSDFLRPPLSQVRQRVRELPPQLLATQLTCLTRNKAAISIPS